MTPERADLVFEHEGHQWEFADGRADMRDVEPLGVVIARRETRLERSRA
jgi:hypothetical protein